MTERGASLVVAGFNALYDRWDGRGKKTGARFGAPEHVTLVVTPDSLNNEKCTEVNVFDEIGENMI